MIQRSVSLAGALAILASTAAPAGATDATLLPPSVKMPFQRLPIDTDHSSVEFRIGFMGVSSVHGSFGTWEGTMMYDPAHFERTTVTIAILADSINTAVPARDRDLRSDHFFDVKKFPYITFTSSSIAPRGKDCTVTGNLTLHGVTKTVALELTPVRPLVKDAWQNERMGFAGKLALNRKDYGIEGIAFWNNEFDPGRRAIADHVDIDFTVEAELANMDTRDFPKAQAFAPERAIRRRRGGVPRADGVRSHRRRSLRRTRRGRAVRGRPQTRRQRLQAVRRGGPTNTMSLEYLRHLSA